jgi:hypothetical protein
VSIGMIGFAMWIRNWVRGTRVRIELSPPRLGYGMRSPLLLSLEGMAILRVDPSGWNGGGFSVPTHASNDSTPAERETDSHLVHT